MDENGIAISKGIFNSYNFTNDGINQITQNMLILLPIVYIRRSTYWTDGVFLEADIQYPVFDASPLKVCLYLM